MNTSHDVSNPRIPKPLDTIITALGIALFIVFAAVGVNQADDRRAVTGNNQRHSQSVNDEQLFVIGSGTFAEPATTSAAIKLFTNEDKGQSTHNASIAKERAKTESEKNENSELDENDMSEKRGNQRERQDEVLDN